ncbi:P-loop containing nucleoside triphosphate hydrolase protein [Trametes gibbosa]|nr:P-loop containing nucleoside triphosphate hydrolase protein [Trametes gibbosa]
MLPTIEQDFIPSPHFQNPIHVHRLPQRQWGLLHQHICDHPSVYGLSVRICSDRGGIDGIAIASTTDIFYLGFSNSEGTASAGMSNFSHFFDGSLLTLAGFGMARLALHLHRKLGVHVKGVELSTLFTTLKKNQTTPANIASMRIHPGVDQGKINAIWYGKTVEDVCLRAWLSAALAEVSGKQVNCAARVDTKNLPDSHLVCLSQLLLNVELLEAERPTQQANEFDSVEIDLEGNIVIRNARYSTRVRRSNQTSVIMETAQGHSIVGHAVRTQGKGTGVVITGGKFRGDIERIRVVGREELTNSELAREEFVLSLLQGTTFSLVDSPYIRLLWFPTSHVYPRTHLPTSIAPVGHQFTLNQSQRDVVAAMTADNEPLVIVHGAPGTGKTTTIAAALDAWASVKKTAWVIAQSNVGVKNIAQNLLKNDVDFRLLVSKEFYVEWHEHLYEGIDGRLIRSDDLCLADPVEMERKIGVSTVMLCTISMLSNPAVMNCGFFELLPVERLVVDEASQIDTFEFMHLFHKFRKLEKVCMFGDPKQLPPFGKESAPEMKTIYDLKHLKTATYFLNTQYRMPIPLGNFISECVYDGKLKSMHKITDRSAVKFVDVRKGREEKVGSSWKARVRKFTSYLTLLINDPLEY